MPRGRAVDLPVEIELASGVDGGDADGIGRDIGRDRRRGGQLERGHDVHRMGEAGVVALEGECGRAGAVHLVRA